MAGLFDRIIDFIFDKNEKYIVLTKDLEALASELDSYPMPRDKYVHTYDYKELSDRCLDSEKAAEKLIRTFHLFRSSFVNDLEKAYHGFIVTQVSNVSTFAQEIMPFADEQKVMLVSERWEQGVIPIVDAELPYIDNHTPYICPQCGGTLRKTKDPMESFMDVRITAPEGVSINEKRDRSKTAPGSSDSGVF